jgi:hypothetical protein
MIFVAGLQEQLPAAVDQILAGWNHVDMVGFHGGGFGNFGHGYLADAGEQSDKRAIVFRSKVLDEDNCDSAFRRDAREKLSDSLQTSSRCTDRNDRKQAPRRADRILPPCMNMPGSAPRFHPE